MIIYAKTKNAIVIIKNILIFSHLIGKAKNNILNKKILIYRGNSY